MISAIGSGWTYMYLVRTEPLKIGERPVTDREKMLGRGLHSFASLLNLSQFGHTSPCPPV